MPAPPQNPALDDLFDSSYLRKGMSPLDWVLLVLWTPFGTVLALVRVILTALVCLYAVVSEKVFKPVSPSDKTYASAHTAA